jgi:deoxyribonuclease V
MKKARRADVKALKKTAAGHGETRALSSLLAGAWWEVSPPEATQLQKELQRHVDVETSLPKDPDLVATTDVSFNVGGDLVYAAVIVWSRRLGKVVERRGVAVAPVFPYIPGFLSFREIPPLLEVFAQLEATPEVVLCDGQGIAHPRRVGIATHLGMCLGLPAVGSAKSVLCGRFEMPAEERGSTSPLVHKGETIGYALRTRQKVSPVFVSPGHKCRLEEAAPFVLSMTSKYRIPDPIRAAHDYANELRRDPSLRSG